jgi:hypothetical protein
VIPLEPKKSDFALDHRFCLKINSKIFYKHRVFFFFVFKSSGIGKASFIHALIVIFLEFFAWGLLTDQVITVGQFESKHFVLSLFSAGLFFVCCFIEVLNETFPNSTFLANGLIHGVKV